MNEMSIVIKIVLMSHKLKTAIEELSQNRVDVNTKVWVLHSRGKRSAPGVSASRVRENTHLLNEFRVVVGAGSRRQKIMHLLHIPGYKVSMWMMDHPITKHWQPRVAMLAKLLRVNSSKTFDILEREV